MSLSPRRAYILALLAAVAAASCGETAAPDPADPQADQLETIACPSVALAAASGVPGDRIAVGSPPGELDAPLFARVLSDAGPEVGYTFLGEDDAGDLSLVVPLHPSGDAAGGPVRVRISDGAQACEPLPLTIAALPPAGGEFSDVVDLLRGVVADQAGALGATVDSLVSTPLDELPGYLIPLGALQSVISHPENPNSLQAAANGTAPDFDDARIELLDRLLARTGLGEILAATGQPAAGPSSRDRTAAAPPPPLPDLTCDPLTIGADAALLDHCMDLQASAAFRLAGASGTALKKLADVVAVLGFVPGLGQATALAGATLWTALNADGRTVALLPSSFTDMTLIAGPGSLLEDSEIQGSWSASVAARNGGWDMGKELMGALLQAAGAIGAFDRTDLPGDPLASTLAGIPSGPISERLLKGGSLDEFQIEPETFGPVSITGPDWSQARILGDAIRLVPDDSTLYEAWATGTATLSVRTRDGEFGGQQIAEQVELAVTALDLDIHPAEAWVGAGEAGVFDIRVTGAAHPEAVAVDPQPAQGSAVIEYFGDAVHRVTYTAPASPDYASPDLLTVRFTGATGARREDPAPRTATATIRFGAIEVSASETSCVPPGGGVTVEAAVEGIADASVEWAADGPGTIESTGDLSAVLTGTAAGAVTVSASVVGAPALADQVVVEFGTCACTWSISVDGAEYAGQSGDEIHLVETDLGDGVSGFTALELRTAAGRYAYISPATEAGVDSTVAWATDTWPATVNGNIDRPSSLDLFYTRYPGSYVGDEPEWSSAWVTLSTYEVTGEGEATERLIAGSSTGTVSIGSDEDYRVVPFAASFQFRLADGVWRCTVP